MHASQSALSYIVGDAALRQACIQACGLEFVQAPRAGEKTTFIRFTIQTNFEYAADLGFLKEHMQIQCDAELSHGFSGRKLHSEPLFKDCQAEENLVIVILSGLMCTEDALDRRRTQVLVYL